MAGKVSSPKLYFLSRVELAKIVALGICQAAVLVAWILLVWRAVDAIVTMQGDVRPVLPWLLALLIVALLNGIVRALEFSICERLGFNVVRRLRMEIYRHMAGMTARQIQHRSRGSLLLRMTGDLTMLRTWISRGIGRGTIGAIVITGVLTAVAFMSVLMAVVAAMVFLTGAALSLTTGRRLRYFTAAVRRRRSLLASNIDEQLNTLHVVQAFGRFGGEHERLSRQNDAMTLALIREARIRGRLRGISSGTGWLAVVAVLAAGIFELAEGYISVGMVIAAATGIRHLTGPIRSLGFAQDYWRRAWISRRKIQQFLRSRSRPVASPFQHELRLRRGTIEFDGVCVAGALENISGSIGGGERVAVVGPSGAGKSTLLGIVARLVEPDAGEVLLDGKPLASCSLRSSSREIGMVSGDLPLMRGTLRRNITYRRPSATDAEIWQVAAACGLEETVRKLPSGLDFWVTEGGKNLSLGERQRLALARAILGYPRILLLDEPTANLDEASRQVFREVLVRYPGTILLATHDADDAALMDQVWRLDGGRLVETSAGNRHRQQQWQERETLVPSLS
ncbi:MAG: ABC transporter ATP-binding protein/permease [Pseudomonadota bacterium]|nr:ABC transporter ATP-binding protein/permease [Pseudomonadota bacterium]